MTTFLRHRFNDKLIQKIGDRSLKDAAKLSGVSDSTMRRMLEIGQGKNIMSIRVFIQLCDWLEVDPADFFMTRNEAQGNLTPLERAEHAIFECSDIPKKKRDVLISLLRSG